MEATHCPLMRFLKEELQLPTDSITLALQHSEQIPNLLPITLWQYGLITFVQLDQIYDGSIPILQEGKRTGSLFAMANRE